MVKLTEKQEQLVSLIEFRFEGILDTLKELNLGFTMKPKDMNIDIIKYNSTRMKFEFNLCMLDVSDLDDDTTKGELQNELTTLLQMYYTLVESYMCIIANEKRLGRDGVKTEISSMICSDFQMKMAVEYCSGILNDYVRKKTTRHNFSVQTYNIEILTKMPSVLDELINVENAKKRF